MKLVVTFLVACCAWFGVEEHDIAMTVFTVSESAEGLRIEVEYDRDDYASINTSQPDKSATEQLQNYLNQTTSWIINGDKKIISVDRITSDGHHYKAHCHVKLANNKVTDLKVYNRFLLDIQDQTNVIMLKLHDDSRGFRMHEGRQQITVEY